MIKNVIHQQIPTANNKTVFSIRLIDNWQTATQNINVDIHITLLTTNDARS